MKNIILDADSYKFSHWMLLPEGQQYSTSYIAPRGGFSEYVVPFGIQMWIKKTLLTPITMEMIDEAEEIISPHMGNGIFNREMWEHIVKVHNGYLPVEIKAIPEGMVVPNKTVLVTITNTDPVCVSLPSFLETSFLRDVWYPTTVATVSHRCVSAIKDALIAAGESTDLLKFMLHDFGFRGVSSHESAGMGGLAHLINSCGTDTVAALVAAKRYYNCTQMPAFSVIASEHSVACSLSNANKRDDYKHAEKMVSVLENRVKETGTFQIVSAVADTYNTLRFATYIARDLNERIKNSGGKFVVRPDSGDPVTTPIEVVKTMMEHAGYTTNERGYKLLPPHLGVLQGDGINEESIKQILKLAMEEKLSPLNFVFGMGGALLQHCDRDWSKFAMKCSAIKFADEDHWVDVFKDPITDKGKRSFRGKLDTFLMEDGSIQSSKESATEGVSRSLMNTVYKNGLLLVDVSFDEVRGNAGLL